MDVCLKIFLPERWRLTLHTSRSKSGIRFQRAKVYRPLDVYAGNYAGMIGALNAGVTTVFDFLPLHQHTGTRRCGYQRPAGNVCSRVLLRFVDLRDQTVEYRVRITARAQQHHARMAHSRDRCDSLCSFRSTRSSRGSMRIAISNIPLLLLLLDNGEY
jgi:hypothetical protein